jgi:hypothetical protein
MRYTQSVIARCIRASRSIIYFLWPAYEHQQKKPRHRQRSQRLTVAARNDVVIENSSLRLSAVRGPVRGARLASLHSPRAGGTGFRLASDLAGEARNPDRTLGCGSAQVRGWRLRGVRGAVRGSSWRVCGRGSDIKRGAAASVERGHAIIANLGSVSNSVGQRGVRES